MAVEQLTFTDLPAGKGLRPEATGYQVKACSPGLPAAARDVLSNLCAHYGDAVYRHAPARAKQSERAWRERYRNERLPDVAPDVLAQFPHAICYTRVGLDLFALTRIRYYGKTHDGRLGNFFAHSLVFAPGLLAEMGGNPLAVARSGALLRDDTSEETRLPSLASLPPATTGRAPCDLLAEASFRRQAPALVDALAAAPSTGRPVVVCLCDWRQAAPLAEALLEMFPAAARSRTTVCTYESDRNWRPPTDRRGAERSAAHHLLVLCGDDERAFSLRPDEYQSRFAVFNFVADRFSQLDEPGPYASFAVECVLEGRAKRLRRHHALVDRLEVSGQPRAWDLLVPVVRLEEGETALVQAAHCLAEVSVRPGQARSAMEMLLPHVQTLAAADNAEALAELRRDLGLLSDRLAEPTMTKSGALPEPLAELRDLAGKALAEGRTRTALTLLEACGARRDSQLEALLEKVLEQPPAPAAATDGELWLELLVGALQPAPEDSTTTQWKQARRGRARRQERLLTAAFRAAADLDRVGELWNGAGGQLVLDHVATEWEGTGQKLVAELLRWVTVERCASAHARLLLELVVRDREHKDVDERLIRAAAAAGRGADEEIVEKLVTISEQRFPEALDRAPVLGLMAEATFETTAHGPLRAAYSETLEGLEDEQQDAVRCRLAQADAKCLLSDELLARVLPWDAEESPGILKRWARLVADKTSLWRRLGYVVAARLQEADEPAGLLPLAGELLGRLNRSPGDARRALVAATALVLPPEPLSESWQQRLTPLPDDLPATAAARLRVLVWLRKVEQQARKSEWSVSRFPSSEPTWHRDVRSLAGNDRQPILAWCLELCASHGLSEPQQARALTRLLQAVGMDSSHDVGEAIHHLLHGRDPVTRVVVAAAFARDVLQTTWDPDRAMHVAAIVKPFDKSTRRLLAQHLSHRFGPRDPNYEQRLRRLGKAAELPGLRPIRSSEVEVETASPHRKQDASLWDLPLRFLRGALSGLKGTPASGAGAGEEREVGDPPSR